MRLFIGIDIDEAIRERIASYIERLRVCGVSAKFVSSASYHITLKFLGETQKFDAINAALLEVKSPAFDIAFRGTGFFPNAKRPRIFWAGIKAGPQLAELAEQISRAMEPLGFEREGPYKPHLTLARSGSGNPHLKKVSESPGLQRISELIASEPPPEFGTMRAEQFYLFESKLQPKGAVYEKRATFELKA